MYKISFFGRLKEFGIEKIILSYDTLVAIIVFFAILYFTNGKIEVEAAQKIMAIFIEVSAILFSIVLAGLAIVTSFTDKEFIYVWKKIGEFDNIITLFQYNLYIPFLIVVFSLILSFAYYNVYLFILLISLFVYMLVSLIDLVNFVCKYALQRGEFIKQLGDKSQ
jgi:hypothetical protein